MVTRKKKLVAPESPSFQVPETTQVHEDESTGNVVHDRSGKKVTSTAPKGQKISASKDEISNVLLNSAKSTRQPRPTSEGICDPARYELLSKWFKGHARGPAQLLDSLMGGAGYPLHTKVTNKYTDYVRCGQLHTGQSYQSRLGQ